MGRPLRITGQKSLESTQYVPVGYILPNSVHLHRVLAVSGTSYTLRTGFFHHCKTDTKLRKKQCQFFLPTVSQRLSSEPSIIITPARAQLYVRRCRGAARGGPSICPPLLPVRLFEGSVARVTPDPAPAFHDAPAAVAAHVTSSCMPRRCRSTRHYGHGALDRNRGVRFNMCVRQCKFA